MGDSVEERKRKLERYFGVLGEEEAEELWREIKEARRRTDEKIRRKIEGL